MQPSSRLRRSFLPFLGALGLAGLAVGVLGPAGAGASAKTSKPSAVSLSALAAAVNAAAAQPSFATYAKNYGSALTNPGALKGEKVMVMPGDSQLAACEEIAQAFSVLAKAEGQSPTIFQNDGETSQYITAFEDAIHEGYKSISIECDFNPASVAPVIAQAEKAGVKVIVYGATQQENIQAHVQGSTVDPYALDAQVAAEQAVLQSGGKPFQAIAITSNQAPATAIMQDALMKELSKICPACTVTDYDVEVPEWTADVGSTVTSALIKNPKVSVIFPDYAGMLSDVLAGIEAAHRTTSVRTYLAFGGGTPFIQLQAAPPGSKIIQSDIGGYPVWTGYLLYYQTARVLTGMTPIPYALAYGPDRVATPQNAAQILTTGGWGTDFVNGFRSLLGLSTLSGHALFEAATLNGTMTAKV